jgi:hypothetical protein
VVLVNIIKSNWITDQNSLNGKGLREIAWLELTKYHERVQDRSPCVTVIHWLREATAVLRIKTLRMSFHKLTYIGPHVIHPFCSHKYWCLVSSMLGWSVARGAGGKHNKVEEVSSTINSYIHGTSFVLLQLVMPYSRHMELGTTRAVSNSLQIPKVKEKFVTSLC